MSKLKNDCWKGWSWTTHVTSNKIDLNVTELYTINKLPYFLYFKMIPLIPYCILFSPLQSFIHIQSYRYTGCSWCCFSTPGIWVSGQTKFKKTDSLLLNISSLRFEKLTTALTLRRSFSKTYFLILFLYHKIIKAA